MNLQPNSSGVSRRIVKLSEQPELKERAAEWFSSKWHVPLSAYLESIEESFTRDVPAWYVMLEGERIIAGMGVIENDFHDRKDLTPNVCAVYTEPDCRCRGICGAMLAHVERDMASLGIRTLYLLTDHESFYERYGWEYLCPVTGDGEEEPSRMYVRHIAPQKVRDITVVSLSRGILGESFVRHELEIGLRRLEALGCHVHFAEHALAGLSYIADHPEDRARDLLAALESDTDMILCAIGGDDTYRLLPYLFENGELRRAASDKIFLGFSDSTVNHLMLHKVGMKTFYGQAFLPDVCELGPGMLPYSARYFEELIRTGRIARITPSDVWYESREDFSPEAIGTALPEHKNTGFELLQGPARFEGEILGGCIDTLYDLFDGTRYADSPALCERFGLFPSLSDWEGKILLLETSEEKASPGKYRAMLTALKKAGVFGVVSGILMGKPADETYFENYKQLLCAVVNDPALPIVANLSVGHANPRAIVPFGVHATVDAEAQEICFD